MKSVKYLENCKIKLGISGYKLAEKLDITTQAVYRLLDGKTIMSDYTASQVAEILEINPMEIISLCNMERAKKETEKRYWSNQLRKLVASVVVSVGLVSATITEDSTYIDGQNNAKIAILMSSVLFFIVSLFA